MKSRMDRYYNSNEEFVGRTKKNEQLYRKRDYNVYSSNETIIDTSNEVDITKIKDIIKSREDYQRAKSYRTMLNDKKFDYDDVSYEEDNYEEKDYDINALLQKVKEEKGIKNDDEEKVRKLKNTQYDILSKLNVKSKETLKTEEIQKEELQDLINTITHKEEQEDDFDLFDNLKSENTIVTKSAKDLENSLTPELIKQKSIEQAKNKEKEDSFYSDSFTFSRKDFEGLQDIDSNRESNKLITGIIIILIIVILVVFVFVLDSVYNFIPFF